MSIKKTHKSIIPAAGVYAMMAIALVSCAKEESKQTGGQEGTETIAVSASGLMGDYTQDDGTKAGLISNVRVSWEAGDKVYAFDGEKCLGDLTVSLRDSKDYYALLTGEIEAPATGTTKITLVYASDLSATQSQSITDGKLRFDISSQTGGSDSQNTPFVAFGALDYTEGAPALNEKIVDFALATSVMRLNCIGLEASTAITGAKLIGMSNECVLNVTDAGASVDQGTIGNISLTFANDFKASASGSQVIYAGIAKNSTAGEQSLEVQQTKTHEWSFGSKTREYGKSVNGVCQMIDKVITPYLEIEGVKWGLCNVGADEPYKYGDYFAWGATEPYYQDGWKADGKTVFDGTWKASYSGGYNWANVPLTDGSGYVYNKHENVFIKYTNNETKYTSPSANATDAAKTELDPEDDAATVILGSNWRTPTIQEYIALMENTYKEWTTDYNGIGVTGLIVYKVKSEEHKGHGMKYINNGIDPTTHFPKIELDMIEGYSTDDEHLFFPANGDFGDASMSNTGKQCWYWTKSLKYSGSDGVRCAMHAYFNPAKNSSTTWNYYAQSMRYSGEAIRPVYIE